MVSRLSWKYNLLADKKQETLFVISLAQKWVPFPAAGFTYGNSIFALAVALSKHNWARRMRTTTYNCVSIHNRTQLNDTAHDKRAVIRLRKYTWKRHLRRSFKCNAAQAMKCWKTCGCASSDDCWLFKTPNQSGHLNSVPLKFKGPGTVCDVCTTVIHCLGHCVIIYCMII